MTGVPVTGEQYGFCLAFQGGKGNLLDPFLPGNGNGGIQPPEIHICRHDKRDSLKEGVPGRVGRRLVLGFQRSPSEPLAVIRHRHDLELYRSGIITGEQMHRELQAAVGVAVGHQLSVRC